MTADRAMTYEECLAALKDAEGLVADTYSGCLKTIAAFQKDGPLLVAKAQERLREFYSPKFPHRQKFVTQAKQVEIELGRWLPHARKFGPLLDLVSRAMGTALGQLMAVTMKRIQALSFRRTLVADAEYVVTLVNQIFEAFQHAGDEGDPYALLDLPTNEEIDVAKAKIGQIDEGFSAAGSLLNEMAELGFLAGVQVATAFRTISEYIEARNYLLLTYLEATDYYRESDYAKGIVLRGGVAQAATGAIEIAIGQYAPLILPKIFSQVPVIGAGFAILDVAKTIDEKRKAVEERRNHDLEVAEARLGRGALEEMDWLDDSLKSDQAALDELMKATVQMCYRLITLAQSPEVESLNEAGS